MSSIGIVLAALGAVSWALLDVLRKRIGEDVSATSAVAALTLFQLPWLIGAMGVGASVGTIAKPWSVIFGGFPTIPPEYWAPFAGTVLLNVVANFLFLRAVQVSPLGLTIPYLSFTPVFTALLALVTLGETPTLWGWAGIGVVTVGAFALNPGSSDHGPLAPIRALWDERGSFYMLIVALVWSITPLLDKVASQQTNVMGHTALVAAGIFAFFLVGRGVKDRGVRPLFSEFGKIPLILGGAAAVNVLAMVFQLSAYYFMDIAYVETLKRAVGVIAATVVGWLLYDESDVRRRMAAAIVMALGVALVLIAG